MSKGSCLFADAEYKRDVCVPLPSTFLPLSFALLVRRPAHSAPCSLNVRVVRAPLPSLRPLYSHSPALLTGTPTEFARHSFLYVTPLQPQTVRELLSHTVGISRQIPAPQTSLVTSL